MLSHKTGAYEGARRNLRLQEKGIVKGSADTIAGKELAVLQMRSHHLARNNPVAASARNKLVANWVGTGIIAKWSTPSMQTRWDHFIKDPNLDGFGTLANTQETWAGALYESGDTLTRMVIRTDPSGLGIPLKLQPLEAEFLDPSFHNPSLNIRHAMQFNREGKPTFYHLFRKHPEDANTLKALVGSNSGTKQSRSILKKSDRNVADPLRAKVPAARMLHGLLRKRPGQWRGVPMLAPVMLSLYEMDELMDATLVRQKAAQAVAWIIKKKDSGALPVMGSIVGAEQGFKVGDDGDDEKHHPDLGAGYYADGSPKDAKKNSKKIQKIRPGGIHYLQKDEDFEFADISDIGTNLIVMLKQHWRLVASALGLTFEQLTGDLTDVNFSSIRSGVLEFRKSVAMIQNLVLVNLLLQPLADFAAELVGETSATVQWVFPRLDWVDPKSDVAADIAEVRAGFSTLEEKIGERSRSFTDTVTKLAEEQGLDITLDTNPAKVGGAYGSMDEQHKDDEEGLEPKEGQDKKKDKKDKPVTES